MKEVYARCSNCYRQKFCHGCANNRHCDNCAKWSETMVCKVMTALLRVDAKFVSDSLYDCMIGKSDKPVMHLRPTIEGASFTEEEKRVIRSYFGHPENGGYADVIFDDFDPNEDPKYRKESAEALT